MSRARQELNNMEPRMAPVPNLSPVYPLLTQFSGRVNEQSRMRRRNTISGGYNDASMGFDNVPFLGQPYPYQVLSGPQFQAVARSLDFPEFHFKIPVAPQSFWEQQRPNVYQRFGLTPPHSMIPRHFALFSNLHDKVSLNAIEYNTEIQILERLVQLHLCTRDCYELYKFRTSYQAKMNCLPDSFLKFFSDFYHNYHSYYKTYS